MQYIDAGLMDRLLDFPSLVGAIETAHKSPAPMIDSSIMHTETGAETPDSFLCLPAWLPGKAMGAKLVTVLPNNPSKGDGLPAVHAIYPIFDGDTGAPLAVIDGTALTYWKTAADSALGAKRLARPDVRCLVVAGAGSLAPWLIRAHVEIHPTLEEVIIWNRNADKAEMVASELGQLGIRARTVRVLEDAVRSADVVCTATSATSPIVLGEWLQPGAHLDLVGSFTPEMRECDSEAIRRSSVFMDAGIHALETGDIKIPVEEGLLERDTIPDLYQICSGEHFGRSSQSEITLFKNGGGGHLDLMTAMHCLACVEKAKNC